MTDSYPDWITKVERQPPWWRDGLVWSVLGLMACALIVGLAIGSVL